MTRYSVDDGLIALFAFMPLVAVSLVVSVPLAGLYKLREGSKAGVLHSRAVRSLINHIVPRGSKLGLVRSAPSMCASFISCVYKLPQLSCRCVVCRHKARAYAWEPEWLTGGTM